MTGASHGADADSTGGLADLEARLRRLEDELEIRELISRYGFLADTRRDEELLDLFTDDAVMESGVGPEVRRTVGRDRIWDLICDPAGHRNPDYHGKGMHVLGTNLLTNVSGDQATVYSYSLMVRREDDKIVVFSASGNRWRLSRVDERWRIRERSRRPVADDRLAEILGIPPWADPV